MQKLDRKHHQLISPVTIACLSAAIPCRSKGSPADVAVLAVVAKIIVSFITNRTVSWKSHVVPTLRTTVGDEDGACNPE